MLQDFEFVPYFAFLTREQAAIQPKSGVEGEPIVMALIRIESPSDPRIAPYVNLRNPRDDRRNGRFIAEGELVVRRLLESRFEVESLLLAESQVGRVAAPSSVPAYVASAAIVDAIAGFQFHRGMLACGVRPQPADWAGLLPQADCSARVVVCSAIRDPENLGGVLRNCAAFGTDLVLVQEHSADPYSRRVLRVSMATSLTLNLAVISDLEQVIERLHEEFGLHCAATVLDPQATPLEKATSQRRLALVFGNEYSGIDLITQQKCQSQLTIPMRLGTDSLNVAVAAGIFLYHFRHPN